MPFISTKTNVIVSKEKETQLKQRLGQAISILPGKSENWLMLAIEGDVPMYFRGDDSQPTAFIEVKVYGSAPSDAYNKMTQELTGIYGDILGIALIICISGILDLMTGDGMEVISEVASHFSF